MTSEQIKSEIAYFGAGCFWSSQQKYSQENGVISTEVGYCSFTTDNGKKANIETVKVEFDRNQTSYKQLIDAFWDTHDSTHRKNKDPTYIEKSILFHNSEKQQEIATKKLKEKLEESNDILTEVRSFENYRKAPEKDQNYYQKN